MNPTYATINTVLGTSLTPNLDMDIAEKVAACIEEGRRNGQNQDRIRMNCLAMLDLLIAQAQHTRDAIHEVEESTPFDTHSTVEVTIDRISYGQLTFVIKGATSLKEAKDKALADAGNWVFSESAAEYEVSDTWRTV